MQETSLKIGIYGSSADETEEMRQKAIALGQALGKYGCTIITGACPGLPEAAAEAAKNQGSAVWGFSPAFNAKEHNATTPGKKASWYDKILYVPTTLQEYALPVRRKYRNVISTSHVDAGIIISGRWGTMHEFCSLMDYGKIIGVLTGTGGFADELAELTRKIIKKGTGEVFFDNDPTHLIQQVVRRLT